MIQKHLLSVIVFVSGLAISLIALEPALTGFLGLGINPDVGFITIEHQKQFDVQDNHTRYLGGFFFLAGLVCIYGAFKLETMRNTLIALCIMIAGAAVFRFLGGNANPFSSALLPSLVAEIVLAPTLAFWLWRTQKGKMNQDVY